MKIFLDTLDTELIEKYIGLISGVTTNPTFQQRFGMFNDIDMVNKIRSSMPEGEIHVEAIGNTATEIVQNANRIINETGDKNLVFKIPFSEEGISACKVLISSGLKTSLHLVYSLNQAILAATIKSTYICPLVGRLDDIGHDATENIKMMKQTFQTNNEETLIMASSIRHPQHVLTVYTAGVDAITIPPNVLSQMFYHPLTDIGKEMFCRDFDATKSVSSRVIKTELIVDENDSIGYCLAIMVKEKSGAIVVLSKEKELKGIFTTGDLKRLIHNKELDLNTRVERYMNTNPVVIDANEPASEAKKLFDQFNINQLVVMDDNVVIGILDIGDVVR